MTPRPGRLPRVLHTPNQGTEHIIRNDTLATFPSHLASLEKLACPKCVLFLCLPPTLKRGKHSREWSHCSSLRLTISFLSSSLRRFCGVSAQLCETHRPWLLLSGHWTSSRVSLGWDVEGVAVTHKLDLQVLCCTCPKHLWLQARCTVQKEEYHRAFHPSGPFPRQRPCIMLMRSCRNRDTQPHHDTLSVSTHLTVTNGSQLSIIFSLVSPSFPKSQKSHVYVSCSLLVCIFLKYDIWLGFKVEPWLLACPQEGSGRCCFY